MTKNKLAFAFFLLVPFLSMPAHAREFAGINFGVALSLTHDTGSHRRINEATLDENGIVRVVKDSNDIARVMLETHYFFENNDPKGMRFLGVTSAPKWGHGPFVALQPGSDEVVTAIGIGWMVGFRKDENANTSWNLGLGVVVDPSVTVLGNDVKENKPLPAGETKIRLMETSQVGILVLSSYTFD